MNGIRAKNAGISQVLANSNPVWKLAWRLVVYNLPTGWTGIGEDIRFMVEALNLPPPKLAEQAWGGLVSRVGLPSGLLEFVMPIVMRQMVDEKGHARQSQVLRRTKLVYNNANGDNRRVDVSFDLGERIKQVRAVEDEIDRQQAELDAKLEPFFKFAEMGRAEILAFLNQTNQKSANTEFGGCHWKPKITWRVEDKEAFSRHVIGAQAWELITWAAQPTNCNTFTDEHKMPPPGLVRNAVNILYITPPVKPKNKNKVVKDD
jgi:hypothetical protein